MIKFLFPFQTHDCSFTAEKKTQKNLPTLKKENLQVPLTSLNTPSPSPLHHVTLLVTLPSSCSVKNCDIITIKYEHGDKKQQTSKRSSWRLYLRNCSHCNRITVTCWSGVAVGCLCVRTVCVCVSGIIQMLLSFTQFEFYRHALVLSCDKNKSNVHHRRPPCIQTEISWS